MVEHDDADAPIWATEFGAPTGTSDQAVSPEEQGEQLAEAIEQWLSWEVERPADDLLVAPTAVRRDRTGSRTSGCCTTTSDPNRRSTCCSPATGGTPP